MNNTVEYKPSELVRIIDEGFCQIFKPFAKYKHEKSGLWQKCIDTVSDHDILKKLIFCNDIIRLPPVKVFLCLHPEVMAGNKLTAYEKKFIGSFFSYIFTNIFCYRFKKKAGINNPCVRTALYFYDRQDDIVIVPDLPGTTGKINQTLCENGRDGTAKQGKSAGKKVESSAE